MVVCRSRVAHAKWVYYFTIYYSLFTSKNGEWSSPHSEVGHSKGFYYLRFTIYYSLFTIQAHSSAPLRHA